MADFRNREGLAEMRRDLLQVSVRGVAGALSAIGPKVSQVRVNVARLTNLGRGLYANRDEISAFAGGVAGLAGGLGNLAEDLLRMTQ